MTRKTPDIADLERQLIEAKGHPRRHARVRETIRDAGFPALADELDRIAARRADRGRGAAAVGIFSKKEPPVDRRKVMDLVAAEMRSWDKDDQEHCSGRKGADLRRLEAEAAEKRRNASAAEQRAATAALQRHGYPG